MSVCLGWCLVLFEILFWRAISLNNWSEKQFCSWFDFVAEAWTVLKMFLRRVGQLFPIEMTKNYSATINWNPFWKIAKSLRNNRTNWPKTEARCAHKIVLIKTIVKLLEGIDFMADHKAEHKHAAHAKDPSAVGFFEIALLQHWQQQNNTIS